MADHHLIAAQLEVLAKRLPAAAFDEVADGLWEHYQAQLTRTPDPEVAARAAIAEFGDAETVTAAFLMQSPWRRSAIGLLATGPIIGGLWAATLITSGSWYADAVPLPARLVVGGTVLTIVAAFVSVVVTRRHYRLTRLATVAGAVGLLLLDAAAVTWVLIVGAPRAWPLAVALTASTIRALAVARMIPALTHQ